MAMPRELAVDMPLKLGSTFNGNTTDGFLTYRYDFQPDSMHRVSQGDLLFFGTEQEKIKFIPELPEGDAPFHYDGPCTTLQQQEGEEAECVAIFNGSEWILQLVSARISAKHVRGTPQIPGYNVDLEEEPGGQQAAAQADAQTAGVARLEAAADDDIDPDLNDALDEALFAADHSENPAALQQPSAAASPPARMQQHQRPLHQAVQQLSVQQAPQQQPLQQQQHQQEQEEEDPDDPWAEYDATTAAAPHAAPAAPAAPQLPAAVGGPSAGGQAAAATAAVSAQPSSTTAAAGVRIVSHEEGQDEDDDEDEEAVHACSDDESDGLGVELL